MHDPYRIVDLNLKSDVCLLFIVHLMKNTYFWRRISTTNINQYNWILWLKILYKRSVKSIRILWIT